MKRHIDKYLEEARKEKSSKSEEPAEVAPVEYEDEAKPVDPGEENSVVPGEGKPDDPDEEEAVNPNEEDPVDPDEVKPDGPGVGETILPDEKKPYDQDEVNPVDPDEKNLVDPDEDEKTNKKYSECLKNCNVQKVTMCVI
nr:hypothetical transcript [Hymenolepis microstoma]